LLFLFACTCSEKHNINTYHYATGDSLVVDCGTVIIQYVYSIILFVNKFSHVGK